MDSASIDSDILNTSRIDKFIEAMEACSDDPIKQNNRASLFIAQAVTAYPWLETVFDLYGNSHWAYQIFNAVLNGEPLKARLANLLAIPFQHVGSLRNFPAAWLRHLSKSAPGNDQVLLDIITTAGLALPHVERAYYPRNIGDIQLLYDCWDYVRGLTKHLRGAACSALYCQIQRTASCRVLTYLDNTSAIPDLAASLCSILSDHGEEMYVSQKRINTQAPLWQWLIAYMLSERSLGYVVHWGEDLGGRLMKIEKNGSEIRLPYLDICHTWQHGNKGQERRINIMPIRTVQEMTEQSSGEMDNCLRHWTLETLLSEWSPYFICRDHSGAGKAHLQVGFLGGCYFNRVLLGYNNRPPSKDCIGATADFIKRLNQLALPPVMLIATRTDSSHLQIKRALRLEGLIREAIHYWRLARI